MTRQGCLLALVLAGTGLIGLTSPAPAQDFPAQTYQPGFWQPLARVNPRQPVQVRLVNQTAAPLEYGLTESRDIRVLPPGASVNVPRLPLPAFMNINPADELPEQGLRYNISVQNNLVTVRVISISDLASDRTFNIDTTGGIYIY
ncbi:hypothetical protein [Leptolyngbya sp. FACHB-261]|uniref:hypothetical protein n=1 Tax=Leptolyngbya sp. FACHB-261 TaxID=2692806 RepID=UPI0016842AE9|nr:hypothetical protein [Leptolyngbya sp. FACHB-261]MBD2103382.1 hypothetical protein [Leptolyngbya sp. FACHB-261]